ncbi:hypothetical protein Tco_0530711 [Tanacetum coccineum]
MRRGRGLRMFSLSCPASKLVAVGKASPWLSSLVGDAVLSAPRVLEKWIELLDVGIHIELRVCDGAQLGFLSLHPAELT